MDVPIDAISRHLATYFDALYFGDTDRFSAIFHPRARLFCVDSDQLIEMDLDQYLTLVAGRQSPAARGDARHDEILGISIPTKSTAHARVREFFLPKHFTDELTFLHVGGQWKIISKVWHFDLIAAK